MGRPKKNKAVDATPIVPESSLPVQPTKGKTKAEIEHAALVRSFNETSISTEVSKANDSLNNLNEVLDSTSVDEIFESAKTDKTVILAKSSTPDLINNVDEPANAPLTEVPKDLTVLKKAAYGKGDEDAPFFVIGDDLSSRNFAVYDDETDRVIEDVFYANRTTGAILVLLKGDKGENIRLKKDENQYPVLILKNRKTYFKRNIKI